MSDTDDNDHRYGYYDRDDDRDNDISEISDEVRNQPDATSDPGHAIDDATGSGFELIAVASRSGFDESFHYGALVCLSAGGDIEYAIGNPELPVYARSCNKPIQAVAMVRAGLALSPDLLALVCASHSGTPHHVGVVARILASAGLRPDALANTADWPLDTAAAHELIRTGEHESSIAMNCSGKHAGMLATCRTNGWASDPSYLDSAHPLQQRINDTIAELTVRGPGHVGVDGCGAPAHVLPLVGLAQAFRAIAIAPPGPSAEHAVYSAMTAHPFNVGGPGRDVTALMEAIPGLMAKDGAQGMYAAALPDGRAVALKIADGGDRARPPVMARALELLGVDVAAAAGATYAATYGHGRVVGNVRATF